MIFFNKVKPMKVQNNIPTVTFTIQSPLRRLIVPPSLSIRCLILITPVMLLICRKLSHAVSFDWSKIKCVKIVLGVMSGINFYKSLFPSLLPILSYPSLFTSHSVCLSVSLRFKIIQKLGEWMIFRLFRKNKHAHTHKFVHNDKLMNSIF